MTIHNKSLDGLRGLAAFSVVIFHFFCGFVPFLEAPFYPDLFKPLPRQSFWVNLLQYPPLSILHNGHFAVCIFFVLSGYVLSIPFFSQPKDDTRLKARIMGRYLRLNIPIAFAIFLSFLVWLCHGYCFQEVSSITGSDWMKSWPPDVSIVDLVKQMVYKGVVLGNSSLVPVLWTLRIEFLGSVVLLTYLILTSPSSQYLAVVYAVVIYFVFKQEAFFHLLFLGGMLIGFRGKDGESLLLSNRKVGLVSVAVGILIGGYMQGGIYEMLPVVTGYWVPFWNMSVFWHGIGAVLVVFGVTRGAFSTFLQGDFVLFLGKISFSLYLVHMIVMGSIVSRLFLWLPRNPFVLLLEFLIYLAICFSASWLFCRYIDKFSLKLSHAFAKAVV